MSLSFSVDESLPRLLEALQASPVVILQAPPGAGKTTRVPLFLLTQGIDRIIMLEPRRLAAVNAAHRMAALLGEEVGHSVGYAIRFERKCSSATRLEVVTEGILTRRLHFDPQLIGIQVVIFDEFHERSLHADTALALCREIQSVFRPDLKIIIMSASLDTGQLLRMLGNPPLITATVRQYPLTTRYYKGREGDPVTRTVQSVLQALQETSGDILVFLPGKREILQCCSLLESLLSSVDRPLLVTLLGELPFSEQQKAILPASRRRIILATNIAETSLTIEGVTTVVDSGLCRLMKYDPARGINHLITTQISAASATQRAGRAARLGPGVCYRVWDQSAEAHFLSSSLPEILNADLAELVLHLASWGIRDPLQLSWIDPPPAGHIRAARQLLLLLGALDSAGVITPLGRKISSMPLHPRHACMLTRAAERQISGLACDCAAILSERDFVRRSWNATDSPCNSPNDLLDRLEILHTWRNRGVVPGDTDKSALKAVDRVSRQLMDNFNAKSSPSLPTEEEISLIILWGYPDRLAKQRRKGGREYLLVNGSAAVLSVDPSVNDPPYLVATTLTGTGSPGSEIRIRQAQRIESGMLLREFGAEISIERTVVWNERLQRVDAGESKRLWGLELDRIQEKPDAIEALSAILSVLKSSGSLDLLPWDQRCKSLCARVELLRARFGGRWPDFSFTGLFATLESWLAPFLGGITTRDGIAKADIFSALLGRLSWEERKELDCGAPLRINVPSGSSIPLIYTGEGKPILAVKLQELFGLSETPKIAWGEVPILLHLLSPAGRPVQVTEDLRNFWDTIYPEVKKELKGRYPRHPWPDDPWNAVPTRKTSKGMKRN